MVASGDWQSRNTKALRVRALTLRPNQSECPNMADEILADQIRAFTFDKFIDSALASNETVRVRVGDVHSGMSFSQRVPLVCASLRAKKFQQQLESSSSAAKGRERVQRPR
jgi:hypothetical protein